MADIGDISAQLFEKNNGFVSCPEQCIRPSADYRPCYTHGGGGGRQCALDSPGAHLPESACLPEVLRYTCVWRPFSKMAADGLTQVQYAVVFNGL